MYIVLMYFVCAQECKHRLLKPLWERSAVEMKAIAEAENYILTHKMPDERFYVMSDRSISLDNSHRLDINRFSYHYYE